MNDFSYKTQVRVNLVKLRELVDSLYDPLLSSRSEGPDRSRFVKWNTTYKFLSRIDDGSSSIILPVEGKATGNSARIYFHPSVTSLTREFRSCIEPVHPDKVFAYFDLKAAEFALNCFFCNETEAISRYLSGEDIYLTYSPLFPPSTPRSVIKQILIGLMYGVSPYRIALNCNISQFQAETLLKNLQQSLPNIMNHTMSRVKYAYSHGGYFAPSVLFPTPSALVKVASFDTSFNPSFDPSIKPSSKSLKPFNPNLAKSVYVQSALGFFMQNLTKSIMHRIDGTLLSVFDSMLLEISPSNKQRLTDYITRMCYPLLPDTFKFGTSFFEVCSD